jgi:hypothetical protein
MSTHDDDIEFDFFEEPATQEATASRERGLRRPQRAPKGPRTPMRPPAGFTPLARLIGLIAFAILVVVLLVFWVQSCQEGQKRDAYRSYVADVKRIADDSVQIGRDLSDVLSTPGIKQAQLDQRLAGLVQQQELGVAQAQRLDAPGPLRSAHQNVVEALQFRASGLQGLKVAFDETKGLPANDAGRAGALLAEQAKRLVASDVVWDDLFKESAIAELKLQNVSGVEVPESNFVQTPDLASSRLMVETWQRIHGASTGSGTPTGVHGNGITATKVLPSGTALSESTENTIEAGLDLAFAVDVLNSGESQEVRVVVRLTIAQTPNQIVKKLTVQSINPGETKTVVFRDFPSVDFGERRTLRVDVEPVPGESNTKNNSAEYPVIFSLGQ